MYDRTLKNIKKTWNFTFYTLDSNQPYVSEVSRRSLCLDSGQHFTSFDKKSHSCWFRPHSTACYQNLSLLCLVEEKKSERSEHFQGENDRSFPSINFSIIKTTILSAILWPTGFSNIISGRRPRTDQFHSQTSNDHRKSLRSRTMHFTKA